MLNKKYNQFFFYVVPSLLAFALSGAYAIVDGFFIGNRIGDIGLSTINIAYPVVTLLQALGTGIGMGGSILYSIAVASGEKNKASTYAKAIFTLLLLTSIIFTFILYVNAELILFLLGARGKSISLGLEYLNIIILGGTLQIFATGIVPLIRNLAGSIFAMISMVAGFLTNIILDYAMIFIFDMGMVGAALATIIGQGLTMFLGMVYIMIKKKDLFRLIFRGLGSVFYKIFKVGIAPFGLTMSPILSLIAMNRFSITYGGETAIACYACIAYVTTVVYMLLQGVGDGCQPLMSQYCGQGEVQGWKFIRRMAYVVSIVLAALSVAVLYGLRAQIGSMFGASADVNNMIQGSIPVFLLGIFFVSFTRVTTSCFYAIEKTVYSYILVYAEPIMLFILLLIIPPIMGLNGVWWSMCLAQIICSGIAFVLKRKADCSTEKDSV